MKRLYNQVMENTKRSTWGGSRVGAGRRKRATAQRNGRISVNLDMAKYIAVDDHVFSFDGSVWYVDFRKYADYYAAAAEFARSVNG